MAVCKFCSKNNLHWVQEVNGNYVLYEASGKHYCQHKPIMGEVLDNTYHPFSDIEERFKEYISHLNQDEDNRLRMMLLGDFYDQ